MPRLPVPPENMELRYAQLEELLVGLLEVHDDRKKPLAARFKLFRQQNFPPDVGTTAKTRAAYDLSSVLRVALGFIMVDAFVPQDIVPLVIERDWDTLKGAFKKAFEVIHRDGPATAAVSRDRSIAVLYPRNLHAFSLEKEATGQPGASIALEVLTVRQLRDRLDDERRREEFAPQITIDLHRLATWIREWILRVQWAGPTLFEDFAKG